MNDIDTLLKLGLRVERIRQIAALDVHHNYDEQRAHFSEILALEDGNNHGVKTGFKFHHGGQGPPTVLAQKHWSLSVNRLIDQGLLWRLNRTTVMLTEHGIETLKQLCDLPKGW